MLIYASYFSHYESIYNIVSIFAVITKKTNNRNMAYTDNETYRHIHFAVMAIESGARKLGISGKEMHDRLQKQGLIHRRLIKRYEDLHTQSLDWVADDICETLLNWEKEV